MARSVMGLSVVQVGPEPDRNGPRRLEVVKTNLCVYPPALGLTLEAMGSDGRAPVLRYGEAPKEHRERTQVEECGEWLVGVLGEMAGGRAKPKYLVKLAEDAGFSQAVLYRARKGLEGTVVDTKNKFAADNEWELAGG